jgi:hypothetical protein
MGTGGSAFGLEATELGLYQLGPVGIDFDSFVAEAGETDPLDPNWSLTVHGVCAQPTATAPPAGAAATYLKDVKVVRSVSASNSRDKAQRADCTAGRSPIAGGGGIFVRGDNKGVAFDALIPPASPAAWLAEAKETDATRRDWKLSAAAVCANVSTETDTADYAGKFTQFNFSHSAFNSKPVKGVKHRCGAAGSIVGGGALIRDDAGAFIHDPNLVITRSEPAEIDHGVAEAWNAEATELDPTDTDWQVEAFVVCAPLDGGPPV